MKIIFSCLLIILMFSCKTIDVPNEKTLENVIKVVDTIYVESPLSPIYEKENNSLKNEVKFWKNKVDSIKNSISYKNYENARRIEKIKYYITICDKNPKNKKFFFGWIKRTFDK